MVVNDLPSPRPDPHPCELGLNDDASTSKTPLHQRSQLNLQLLLEATVGIEDNADDLLGASLADGRVGGLGGAEGSSREVGVCLPLAILEVGDESAEAQDFVRNEEGRVDGGRDGEALLSVPLAVRSDPGCPRE